MGWCKCVFKVSILSISGLNDGVLMVCSWFTTTAALSLLYFKAYLLTFSPHLVRNFLYYGNPYFMLCNIMLLEKNSSLIYLDI